MIGHHDNWILTGKRLGMCLQVAAAIAGVYGVLMHIRIPEGDSRWLLRTALEWASDSAKYVIPLCALVIGAVEWYKKAYGPPHIWAMVHHLLNDMHKDVFPSECNLAENRVTLFAVEKRRLSWGVWPPWGTFLVPVERSHHLARRSKAAFRVQDDGKAEGIAGQAYVQRSTIYVEDLPDIGPISNGSKPKRGIAKWLYQKVFCKRANLSKKDLKHVKVYAGKTWYREESIIRHKCEGKSMPRSLCGLPVEVEGEIWGVIVIDSRAEKMIGKEEILKFYQTNAKLLSRLLKYTK